jgi:hypothetical protein
MRVKSNGIGIEGMLIHVHCGGCDTWINETAIELTGVGVDDAGRGVLQFDCPECGSKEESYPSGSIVEEV